jgi:DNA-binding winged helix-turn-helix (wHTH) protein
MPAAQLWRFGPFEFDERTGELRRGGLPIKLQEQPARVLALLLLNKDDLVSREQLRGHPWPHDTFVDFEHSLNTAIKKLREALEDSAERPNYIETLPRKGYRFIAAVSFGPASGPAQTAARDVATAAAGTDATSTALAGLEKNGDPRGQIAGEIRAQLKDFQIGAQSLSANRAASASLGGVTAKRRRLSRWWPVAAALLICGGAVLGFWAGRRLERKPAPVLHRLTFRRGTVWNARFAPDGNSVVYGAAWEGKPVEMFESRVDLAEARALGITGADVLAISDKGEMAVALRRKLGPSGFGFNGTLARLSGSQGSHGTSGIRRLGAGWLARHHLSRPGKSPAGVSHRRLAVRIRDLDQQRARVAEGRHGRLH